MPESSHDLPVWHDAPWCRLLRARVDELGEARVGELLGYSRTTVHLVARGLYTADPRRVAQRTTEVFGGESVVCPVLGEIELRACAEHRQRPFAATNPLRVRLFRACRSCPNNPNRTDHE